MVPDDVASFGRQVSTRLRNLLGPGFVGAWFVGSVALGGYVPGESDIDIIAVSEEPVSAGVKEQMAESLLAVARTCPARGLEFNLYRRRTVGAPPVGADFEVSVNGGPGMATTVNLDPRGEPGFWYVLDRAIAPRHGVVIDGPAAAEVFVEVPRPLLLGAMLESMRWHRAHEGATLYSVLNACRAWRYADEDVLGSKLEGAAWAAARWREPALIHSAVSLRHGSPAQLDPGQVDALMAHVEAVLTAAPEAPP